MNDSKSNIATDFSGFRGLRRLTNHWARPIRPPAYYWYLTFEGAQELEHLVARCQARITFPYYDHVPRNGLHLTLDRIAHEKDITRDDLKAIQAAASLACEAIEPFQMTINSLGGTSGAIGFDAHPRSEIIGLRDALRTATRSVHPAAQIKSGDFHAHIAIAYCNTPVPAAEVTAAVDSLDDLTAIQVRVTTATLVRLERLPRAYAWQAIAQIQLSSLPSTRP